MDEIARRTLPDGRVKIVYPQLFNVLLTISSVRGLKAGYYDDGW